MYTYSYTKMPNYAKTEFLWRSRNLQRFSLKNLRRIIDSLSNALMFLYTNFYIITDSQEANHRPLGSP